MMKNNVNICVTEQINRDISLIYNMTLFSKNTCILEYAYILYGEISYRLFNNLVNIDLNQKMARSALGRMLLRMK